MLVLLETSSRLVKTNSSQLDVITFDHTCDTAVGDQGDSEYFIAGAITAFGPDFV
jgi:hypothetical protein